MDLCRPTNLPTWVCKPPLYVDCLSSCTYQRKKGRDLFDPWLCQSTLTVDPQRVVKSFLQYMSNSGVKVSRAEFEENLLKKLEDAAFRNDIRPLLRHDITYDVDDAAR